MSRIERLLDKAARDGRMVRTAQDGSTTAPSLVATPLLAPPPPAPVEPTGSTTRRLAPAAPSPTSAARSPLPAVGPVGSPVFTEVHTVRALALSPLLVSAVAPTTAAAEQYRELRTRIAHREQDRACRVLLVTSPMNSDGKSVTTLNLALAMAQEFHRRVLVIDGDLRGRSLHRWLGLQGRPGLTDVLTGEVPLEQALLSLPDYRLTFLPAGSPSDHPTELLGSADMRAVVDAFRTQYDRILIDTPPANRVADVGVLLPLVDGVLVVVRAGQTPRPAIEQTLANVDPEKLLGLVLNDLPEPARHAESVSAPAPHAPSPAPAMETRL
jgi:receptor protein-tyrosine kinase/non-specific protein-tyrosine kinase